MNNADVDLSNPSVAPTRVFWLAPSWSINSSRPRAVKWSFVTARVGSTVALTPHWWFSFATGTRQIPRPTWSISQAVAVEFYRRVSGISELAGCQFSTRDVTQEPDQRKLKQTRFEWAERMHDDWIAGVLQDDQVCPLDRVGMFIWDRTRSPATATGAQGRIALADSDNDEEEISSIISESPSADGKIGIYFHGGGTSSRSRLSQTAATANGTGCFRADYSSHIKNCA